MYPIGIQVSILKGLEKKLRNWNLFTSSFCSDRKCISFGNIKVWKVETSVICEWFEDLQQDNQQINQEGY